MKKILITISMFILFVTLGFFVNLTVSEAAIPFGYNSPNSNYTSNYGDYNSIGYRGYSNYNSYNTNYSLPFYDNYRNNYYSGYQSYNNGYQLGYYNYNNYSSYRDNINSPNVFYGGIYSYPSVGYNGWYQIGYNPCSGYYCGR